MPLLSFLTKSIRSTSYKAIEPQEQSEPDEDKISISDAVNFSKREQPSRDELVKKWMFILSFLCITLTIAVALCIVAITQIFHRQKQHTTWLACGKTAAEARLANCHFEPMLTSWVPHECYHSEPSSAYSPLDNATWYLDKELTLEVEGETLERAKSGVYDTLYSHGSYHAEHCLYLWRKLATALDKHLHLVDEKTADIHHSVHCAESMAHRVRNKTKPADEGIWTDMIRLSFLPCIDLTSV